MKKSSVVALCLSLNIIGAPAQSVEVIPRANSSVPAPTVCQAVDTGPNHRVWQWQTFETALNGQIAARTHKYVELATGLNFKDASGQWQPAQEKIEAFAGGAIARRGQNQVIFANNLNSAGAIDMQLADGKRLRSNILGLMYSDPATGQAIVIARLQDSEGRLISDNQVLYADAFEGVRGQVLFTYRRDGLEQDVILNEKPPSPQVYGMNPATTRLAVFTEFLAPPAETITDLPADNGNQDTDQVVSWGATTLGRGKAFSLGSVDVPVMVSKRYTTAGGRHFLLESVKLRDIQKSITKLPEQASNARRLPGIASTQFIFPDGPTMKLAARPIRLALGTLPDKGYVLDYVTVNTAYTNYTFQGDTTFFISGNLNLTGTNWFEGGAIFKYAANASIVGMAGSTFNFLSKPYRPIVFTAKDDNTTGENISGSSGNPTGYYASPALNLGSMSNPALFDFRIAYANRGVSVSGSSPVIYDAQLVNCSIGISEVSGPVTLANVLFSNVKTNFLTSTTANSISAQNVTFNNAFEFLNGSADTSFNLTNCVFVNVTNSCGNFNAGYNGFYRSSMVGSPAFTNTTYPLQRAGAANCYLTNGCAFFDVGTTNIDPNVLWLIRGKTTYAPAIYSNITFSIVTNFAQRPIRDTNAPDPGYHYDPLDYAFGGVKVYSNLTFTAGTAVGCFETPSGTGYGISLYDRVILAFKGTATAPCTLARYSSAQEGGTGLWQNKGSLASVVFQSLSGGYSMNATNTAIALVNFTRHFMPATDVNHYRENSALTDVVAQNSEFYGGGIGVYWDVVSATNCLFDRTSMGVAGSNPCWYRMRNCTIHGASLNLSKYGGTWPVWIEDCVFDGTTLNVDDNSNGNTNITYCDFNAFLTNGARLPMKGIHDVTNQLSFYWQSSWLGSFYLTNASPLLNHGSTTADQFGLYHFTTLVDQSKETNSVVDIGYHYVAVDGYGNPIETDGDSFADYLEDSNGNGTTDLSDLGDWLVSPYNGLSRTNQLIIFTPIN